MTYTPTKWTNPDGTTVEIFVHEKFDLATIGEGATIGDRAQIGHRATIGKGASIGNGVLIGDGLRIGHLQTVEPNTVIEAEED